MSFVLLGILNSQAAGGGAAGSFDHLETVTLTGSASTVSFTGLDAYSNYKHLQIRGTAKTSNTYAGIQRIYINDDTGDNYAGHYLGGDGGSGRYQNYHDQPGLRLYYSAAGSSSGEYAPFVIDILDPFNTNKRLTLRYASGYHDGAYQWVINGGGLWMNQAAPTKFEFEPGGGTYSSGSSWSLYGIKGA